MKFKFSKNPDGILAKLETGLYTFPLSALAVIGYFVYLVVTIFLNLNSPESFKPFSNLLTAFVVLPGLFTIESVSAMLKQKKAYRVISYLAGLVFIAIAVAVYYFNFGKSGPAKYTVISLVLFGVAWACLFLAPAIVNWKLELHQLRNSLIRTAINFACSLIVMGLILAGLAFLIQVIATMMFTGQFSDIYFSFIFPAGFLFAGGLFLSLSATEDVFHLGPIYTKISSLILKYICLPFYLLYSAILYLSLTLNFALSRWPAYEVSWAILGNLVFGLALFILWDFTKENKLGKFLNGYFALSSLPLLGVYFAGIMVRVSTYGLTVNRYYSIVAGLYILFICFYLLLQKKLIALYFVTVPLIIALLSIIGPWSSYNLSAYSQKVTYDKYFEKLCDPAVNTESDIAIASQSYASYILGSESKMAKSFPQCPKINK